MTTLVGSVASLATEAGRPRSTASIRQRALVLRYSRRRRHWRGERTFSIDRRLERPDDHPEGLNISVVPIAGGGLKLAFSLTMD
jgi:hypothetical protein